MLRRQLRFRLVPLLVSAVVALAGPLADAAHAANSQATQAGSNRPASRSAAVTHASAGKPRGLGHANPSRRLVRLSPAAVALRLRHEDGARQNLRTAHARIAVNPATALAPRRSAQALPAAGAATPTPPFSQCPALGLDAGCGILVNLVQGGVQVLADSSQPPYDGSDDTLVGVVNSTSQSVGSLSLSAAQPIFALDGDGICSGYTPVPAGCPFGSTGYEGPGTSFSGINAAGTGGTVDFSPALAPGATAYFGLEEALDPTTTFSSSPTTAEQGGAANPSEHLTTCYTALPVNCATGVFVHSFTDAAVPGHGPALDLVRSYSSSQAAVDGMFGHGWSGSYGMSLTADPTTGAVTVVQENGAQIAFTRSGAAYTAPPRVLATLMANPDGGYTLTRRPRGETFTFSADGRLVAEGDRNGWTTQLQYDSSGRLAQVTDPAGRSLQFTWSGGHVASVTDPLGRTTAYGYDGSGDLRQVTDPAGHTWSFGYDGAHQLLTMTDPRGGTVTNVYDANGRVTSQTDAADLTTSWVYTGDASSDAGGTTTMTDPHGVRTVYVYTDLELVSVTHAAGTSAAATTSYSYDPATLGQATVTAPAGLVTTSTYDADGNLLSRTDANGSTTSYGYDGLDDLIQVTSPLGEFTSYSYDAAGNLLTRIDAMSGVTRFDHAGSPGDVTSVTDPDGRVVSYQYDAYGDRTATSVTPAAGTTDTTSSAYDADGERVCTASADAVAAGISCPTAGAPAVAGTVRFQYNPDGTEAQQTDATGATTAFGYDAGGNRTSVTDAKGNVTRTEYDGDGRTVKVVSAAGTSTETTTADGYDLPVGTAPCTASVTAAQYCTTSTDAAGHTTVNWYDALDRPLAQTRPGGATSARGYDADGRPTTLTDAGGRTVSQTFDADGRLLTRSYSDGSTPAVGYAYDLDGRRVSMTDGTGTTSFAYDADGRLLSRTDGAGATVGYGYDGAGDVVILTYPGTGRQVDRGYDGAGRLVSVTDWQGRTTSFGYDADGNPTSTAYPGGTTAAAGYDAADRLTSTRLLGAAQAPLATVAYTRDADGLLTGETDSGALSGSTSYTYDANKRLLGDGTGSYGYDAAGNPTSFAGTAQSFDASGELITAGGTAYGYDAEGERTGTTPPTGSATHYSYDQQGDLTGVATSVPTPTLSTVLPNSGPAAGGTVITLTGSGLTGATAVHVGSAAATGVTVLSDTTVTAVTPPGTGSQAVTVTTPGGTSAAVAGAQFSYLAAPVVTSLSPVAGPVGGHTTVTVNGSGFTGTTAVHFGTRAASVLAVTPTRLTVSSPAGTGTADVTVTTANGTSASTAADHWTWTAAPVVTRVTPNAGPLAGGTTVTLTGANLTARPVTVRFGTRTATLLRSTGTTLTVKAPAGTGTVDVTVTTPGGTSAKSAADHYGYRPRPAVTRLTPTVGNVRGGTTVAVLGTGLTGATAVHFGSRAARIVSVGATRITVRTPAGTGTVNVTVTTAGGTSATGRAARFTYSTHARAVVTPTFVRSAAGRTFVTVAASSYDGDGLRTGTATATTTSAYTWDVQGGRPLLLDDGTTSYVYGPSGLPLEQIADTGSAADFFFHDGLGSTRLLLDATGAVAATFTFGSYGELVRSTGTATTPLLFAAGFRDAQTGLYYLTHRYYDPATGQFLTLDPALQWTGQPYGYTGGDPVNLVDPSGLMPWNPLKWTAEDWGTAATYTALGAGAVALCVLACVADLTVTAAGAAVYETAVAVGTVAGWVGKAATVAQIYDNCISAFKGAECGNAVTDLALDLSISKAFTSLGRWAGIEEDSVLGLAWEEEHRTVDYLRMGFKPFQESDHEARPC